jgi:hypothetical protein
MERLPFFYFLKYDAFSEGVVILFANMITCMLYKYLIFTIYRALGVLFYSRLGNFVYTSRVK